MQALGVRQKGIVGIEVTVSDALWFLYFTVMFNFYTYTWIQLFAQLVILAHTLWTCFMFRRGILRKTEVISLTEYFLWYGLFTIWCFLSLSWAVYDKIEDSNTLLGVLRICVIGACISYRISTRRDL